MSLYPPTEEEKRRQRELAMGLRTGFDGTFNPAMYGGAVPQAQAVAPAGTQQPAAQQGGVNPLGAASLGMDAYKTFGGSGSAASTAIPESGLLNTGAPVSLAGEGATGGEAAGAGAGWWAALAAAIAANETWANSEGRRDQQNDDWLVDLLTGEVLEQDMNALAEGQDGIVRDIIESAGKAGNPRGMGENIGRFVETEWKRQKKLLQPWEWF